MPSFLHDVIMRGLKRGLGEGLCVFGTPRISARTETREPRESRRGGPPPGSPWGPRATHDSSCRYIRDGYYLQRRITFCCRCRCCKPITIAMEFFVCSPPPPFLSLSPSYTFCLLSFLHFPTRLRPVPRWRRRSTRLIPSTLSRPHWTPFSSLSLAGEVTGTWPRFNRDLPREIRIIYERTRFRHAESRVETKSLSFFHATLLASMYT